MRDLAGATATHRAPISTAPLDAIARATIEWRVHWLLRFAVFSEFVGHGAFGLLTKKAWVAYFIAIGIPEAWARKLMPVVGTMDIALGTLTLLAPIRVALLYMAVWGLFTALLRPLAGEGWWEFIERSYNFGVPGLMLRIHSSGATRPDWFGVLTTISRFSLAEIRRYQRWLRAIMASMLIGHGGFGLVMGKQNLVQFYGVAGLDVLGVPLPTLSAVVGGVEMLLGALCVGVSWAPFFVFVFVWKLGSESLYMLAQVQGALWEVMERGGSFAAPLLWIALYRAVKDRGPLEQ